MCYIVQAERIFIICVSYMLNPKNFDHKPSSSCCILVYIVVILISTTPAAQLIN